MNSNPTTTIITDLTGEVTADEQAAIVHALSEGFDCGFRGGLEDGAFRPFGMMHKVQRVGWLGMSAPKDPEVGTIFFVDLPSWEGVRRGRRHYRVHLAGSGWVIDGRTNVTGHTVLNGEVVTNTLVSA